MAREKNLGDRGPAGFLDIQLILNELVQQIIQIQNYFMVRLQFIVLSRQNDRNSALQLEQHEKTQQLITASKNQLQASLTSQIDNLKKQLQVVSDELQKARRKQELEQARIAEEEAEKEKRKNYNKLPLKEPIQDDEFAKVLEYCENQKTNGTKYQQRYLGAFMKICFFLLRVSGMRVSNLRHVHFRDLHTFFNETNAVVSIPLIKNNNREYIQLSINAYKRKAFLKEPHNLEHSYNFLLQHIKDWAKRNNKPEDKIYDLPFAAAYSEPTKPMSREYRNKVLNKALDDINVDATGRRLVQKAKTTHCFRTQVITDITAKFGIEVARDFVHHRDIHTTDKYVRSLITPKRRRDISAYLLSSPTEGTPPRIHSVPPKLYAI